MYFIKGTEFSNGFLQFIGIDPSETADTMKVFFFELLRNCFDLVHDLKEGVYYIYDRQDAECLPALVGKLTFNNTPWLESDCDDYVRKFSKRKFDSYESTAILAFRYIADNYIEGVDVTAARNYEIHLKVCNETQLNRMRLD